MPPKNKPKINSPPKRVYKLSKATREKMSKAHKGKKHSPETIAKIREARLERQALIDAGLLPRFKHSEATKKKLRKLAKGRKPSKKALKAAATANRDRALERRMNKAFIEGEL